jgi:parallel beta-helix repeat protein
MVSLAPPLPNKVRRQPSRSGELIGQIQPGENVLVVDGPRCADGYTWWFVLSLDGLEGWTAEGDATGYWLIPLQPVSSDWDSSQNAITLTSDQVDNAVDIEAAIKSVTAEDTRPGTVILDGRNGAFVYTGDDRSLNLFVSNLTLRGVNQALIENCDDGLFFDNLPLKNILVEGIEFICRGHGVVAGGAFENVILSNNIFRAKINGIGMGGASSDWSITENVIETDGSGIDIAGAKKIVITNNQISGYTGISLRDCSQFQVSENIIHASHQGILLVQGSWENMLQMNTILGVSRAGIALESGVKDNSILTNRVSCAPGTSCLTVDATPEVVEMNTIAENLP